ncbi:maleylpyruvate isomerase family mycothiol-dependent enzyme [Plantactinospora sp. CA-294935]|uniref:maleylpyruvate isomerase family mycothiol-dependent enzyme n=1 Tax=Plantactinospora sp. CA-294935 TaxID=3240012 RepID=UPI003D8FDE90
MATTADTTIAALRSGHDELAALVRDLGPSDLTRPSGASEWQVSQVLSHLGSGAEINEATLDVALGGRPTLEADFNKQVWARWDAMTPIEHAEGFLEANRRLVERYESLDAATRSSVRIDLGFLPEPVDLATAAGMRLSEFALHEWDVEVAFNRYATVAPEAVPLLLDRLGGLLGWIGRPDEVGDRPVELALRLTDPDRSLGLRLTDRVELVERPEQPAGEISGPAEAFLRLAAGRLSPEHTPDTLTVTGPLGLDDLRRVFPGY